MRQSRSSGFLLEALCGSMPQGSQLGPMLFIVLIDDDMWSTQICRWYNSLRQWCSGNCSFRVTLERWQARNASLQWRPGGRVPIPQCGPGAEPLVKGSRRSCTSLTKCEHYLATLPPLCLCGWLDGTFTTNRLYHAIKKDYGLLKMFISDR